MANNRFSVLQARAVEDKRITNAQFRTLAALGMYGDKDGWCFPKLRTLGIALGKSKQAVGKDILELQKLGYIEIHHQFREDGGQQHSRYRLIFDTRQPDIDGGKDSVDTPSTTDVDAPSTPEIDPPSTPEVDALTPQFNAPLNAPEELLVVAPRPNVYGVYEQEIGVLTGTITEDLKAAEKDYPEDWIIASMREAARNNKRNWKYCLAILKRWKAQGYMDAPRQPAAAPKTPRTPERVKVILPDGTITEALT